MTEKPIDELVRLRVAERFEQIGRELRTGSIPNLLSEMSCGAGLHSSATLHRLAEVGERAIREKIQVRLEAELDACRRFGIGLELGRRDSHTIRTLTSATACSLMSSRATA